MATEVHTKEGISVGDVSPPAYSGCRAKPGKNRTRLFIRGAIVMYVTMLLGFFGVFHVLLKSPYCRKTDGNGDSGPVIVLEDVTFEIGDGVERHQSITRDGFMLKIQSIGDGFIAFFDYHRNLLTVQNSTSGVCYLTSLDFVPDMGMDDTMDNVKNFFIQEGGVTNVDSQVENYNFRVVDPISPAYVQYTNDVVVANQCRGSLSYWIEPTEGNRQRIVRWPRITFCIHIEW